MLVAFGVPMLVNWPPVALPPFMEDNKLLPLLPRLVLGLRRSFGDDTGELAREPPCKWW